MPQNEFISLNNKQNNIELFLSESNNNNKKKTMKKILQYPNSIILFEVCNCYDADIFSVPEENIYHRNTSK